MAQQNERIEHNSVWLTVASVLLGSYRFSTEDRGLRTVLWVFQMVSEPSSTRPHPKSKMDFFYVFLNKTFLKGADCVLP